MAASWSEVVESELFTFCIGPEQEKFTIHSGAVLGLSSYFRSIINSQARQAEAQRICWVHIDKETFLIFSQFAYTGDYAVPDIVAWPDHWGDASPQTEGLQAALERFAAFSDPKHSLNFHVVDYISNLIRYTYNNTESHDHGANANPLRDLLVSFCACVYDGFLINPSFRAVLRDHGEFAERIIDKLKVILD
ncbi:hypothetical protein UCREL1_3095 [Eutypa lata UCREL1]|uniref:BTB domain-containing protein n=1 Tax=Eutypa lata (strain UCR-EL1) TaxID=1287681 RepID=M7TIT6_EUTLA|nr:hypothetical protein UCREL1_3095 [Eutypa lata UCREL1]